jgi:CO/xanthine dehydrogenase Mo-binding subunit
LSETWVGRSVPRVEDAALLTGRGRFIDDVGVPAGTLHAAIQRSPHAHATILGIDVARARGAEGVAAVLTGAEVRALGASLVVGVKAAMECWPIAVDRVRYVGEPVAVVVAADRYLAEDALDLIEPRYEALPAVVDPCAALRATGGFDMAIRRRRLVRPCTVFVLRCGIPGMLVRRLRLMGWWRSTIRERIVTMCWQISRGRSACMR